jgi:hypothetical protein
MSKKNLTWFTVSMLVEVNKTYSVLAEDADAARKKAIDVAIEPIAVYDVRDIVVMPEDEPTASVLLVVSE